MSAQVLLVDEGEEARTALAERLGRSAALQLVGVARDAGEAARLLARSHADLVLVDLHMRDGEEVALCRALHEASRVPIVALVSYITPERWRELQQAGVTHYLLKHVDSAQLGLELERLARVGSA